MSWMFLQGNQIPTCKGESSPRSSRPVNAFRNATYPGWKTSATPHPHPPPHTNTVLKKKSKIKNICRSFSNFNPEPNTETHQRLSVPPPKSFRDSREGEGEKGEVAPRAPAPRAPPWKCNAGHCHGGGSEADPARRYLEPILVWPRLQALLGRAGVPERGSLALAPRVPQFGRRRGSNRF